MIPVTPIAIPRAGEGMDDQVLKILVAMLLVPTRFLPTFLIPKEWKDILPPELQFLLEERDPNAATSIKIWACDQIVGPLCMTAAKYYDEIGHSEAATVLREFVTGKGPQSHTFVYNSQFSLGFGSSGTTRDSVGRALNIWKTRRGGLEARNGTITALGKDFSPVSFEQGWYSPTLEMSPEANIIGSFTYDGRLIGNNQAEWTARNFMSLPSFFAEHQLAKIGRTGVSENHRPDRYGTTQQWIFWRTTLDGELVG